MSSNDRKSVSVFAPASIGNFSVGFDLLGLAVSSSGKKLGDTVTVEQAANNSLVVKGDYANVLPGECSDNLVMVALEKFNKQLSKIASVDPVPVTMTLEKNLPICSGLGSSGTSVVAACKALNEFYDSPLNDLELLELMGECEAGASGSVHYDNIAPTFLGGLRLCDSSSSRTSLLPWPEEWSLILAYSGVDVPTAHARKALPETYPRSVVICQMQYLSHFIDGLHQGDLKRAALNIQDLIAEPYRSGLLPKFNEVTRALKNKYKVLASGISGSGPTLFCVVDRGQNNKQDIVKFLKEEYCQDGGFVVEAKCDHTGARVI